MDIKKTRSLTYCTIYTSNIFIPLEQGLRRRKTILPEIHVANSIVIPLEQGLRRVASPADPDYL